MRNLSMAFLTIFLYKEVPDADRPKTISINTKPKKLAKVA